MSPVSNFTYIRPVGAMLKEMERWADRQMDGQTDGQTNSLVPFYLMGALLLHFIVSSGSNT
jgi:hypothetical protein